MGLAELTQSHGWKNFMAKIYGLGASVVIIGALFKLTHWPGATVMLTVGLVTEALIFAFSAFEPIHEEIDWTLAYPELAGLNVEKEIIPVKDNKLAANSNEAMVKFNAMIEKAGSSNIFEKFGEGIQSLNTQVGQMSDISNATLATNEYTKNMKDAATAVGSFSQSYQESAESVKYSADNLTDAFAKVSQNMDVDFSGLKGGSDEYNQHMGNLNKNLTALNAIFELQLNEADLEQMMADLQGSVEHSKRYNTEITKLGTKLEALNTVYGNMLTAMNVKVG